MTLVHPTGILVQNLFLTLPFFILFIATLIFSGAWFNLLIAFLIATIASLLYRLFLNHHESVPRNAAVLITGCSSGIGEAAALRLVGCGFLVFATVRQQFDADALKLKAGNSALLHPLILDVTNVDQVKSAVEAVKHRLTQDDSHLYALVNNAGFAEFSPVELLPLSTLRAQYNTNVYSLLTITQSFLPLLRQSSTHSSSPSRLILVGSISGRYSIPGNSPYSSSKFAVEALADSLRMELSQWRVKVTVVEPGAIDTKFKGKVVGVLEKGWTVEGGVRGDVGEHYQRANVKLRRAVESVPVEDVSICADAIECAMRDSRPLSRLLSGWTSWLVYIVTPLPAEIYDLCVGGMYR